MRSSREYVQTEERRGLHWALGHSSAKRLGSLGGTGKEAGEVTASKGKENRVSVLSSGPREGRAPRAQPCQMRLRG